MVKLHDHCCNQPAPQVGARWDLLTSNQKPQEHGRSFRNHLYCAIFIRHPDYISVEMKGLCFTYAITSLLTRMGIKPRNHPRNESASLWQTCNLVKRREKNPHRCGGGIIPHHWNTVTGYCVVVILLNSKQLLTSIDSVVLNVWAEANWWAMRAL